MIQRASQSKTMDKFWESQGLDPKTGRNLNHAKNPIRQGISTIFFVFYVMMGGNPFFVVLPASLPIIRHTPSEGITSEAKAALEALNARGLVLPGTGIPTVIHSVFQTPVIHFVQVDEEALVSQGHSILGSKVYSLVDPSTGKSKGGKHAYILGFGQLQYAEMHAALLSKLSSACSPSLAGFARGGSGGGGAVAGGGGAVAASHTHGGKTHSTPTCGHALCTHLHNIKAGHAAIVLPVFEYRCKNGSTKSIVIMGFEKGSWNLFCEKMEDTDNGCWIATIARALREEAKIFPSRYLEDSDIRLGKPIGKTPVFYVQLDRSMVIHDLSRGVLNAQVAADNSDRSLPPCYKEIQAIGFFERVENRLVPVPGNPAGLSNTFSSVVQSWLSS